jgi:hypothetical protein
MPLFSRNNFPCQWREKTSATNSVGKRLPPNQFLTGFLRINAQVFNCFYVTYPFGLFFSTSKKERDNASL